MDNTASSTETVIGLATFLEERWLEAHLPAAERWIVEELGARHIDEVLEDLEELAAALKLKKAELRRLHGEPRPPLAKAASAPAPAAPIQEAAPVQLPTKVEAKPAAPPKSWADTESDADVEDSRSMTPEVSDAASTAPSSCATADGFSMVSKKKNAQKLVTFSDTASNCVSEVSTVPTSARALLFRSEVTLHESDVGGLLKKAIKRIEAATGAKVSVQKKDERRGEKVKIFCQGASKDCVDRALGFLKIDVLEAGAAKATGNVGTVMVSARDAGVLLGSGGATVSWIQSTTKTRISVSKGGADRTVDIRGADAAAVAAAKEAITDALRQVEKTVEVPASAVGALKGRGGSTLQKLEKDTGARIEVPKDGETRLVEIRAPTEAEAVAAVEAIRKIITVLEHTIPDLTSEEAGILIGKKGETIKEIEKYSGARVKISSDGPVRSAHISARTYEQIDKAIDAMNMVMREDGPAVTKPRAASPDRRAAPAQKKPLPTGTAAPPDMNTENFPVTLPVRNDEARLGRAWADRVVEDILGRAWADSVVEVSLTDAVGHAALR
jgi:rRNA processing protein Krr1/Pno1